MHELDAASAVIKLQRREQHLIDALEDALEGMEDMIGYVPEYFRDKWGHQGYIDRARIVLGWMNPEKVREN